MNVICTNLNFYTVIFVKSRLLIGCVFSTIAVSLFSKRAALLLKTRHDIEESGDIITIWVITGYVGDGTGMTMDKKPDSPSLLNLC